MGFMIGLMVGGAVVTALTYLGQQHKVDTRWPSWLLRIAAWWRFD